MSRCKVINWGLVLLCPIQMTFGWRGFGKTPSRLNVILNRDLSATASDKIVFMQTSACSGIFPRNFRVRWKLWAEGHPAWMPVERISVWIRLSWRLVCRSRTIAIKHLIVAFALLFPSEFKHISKMFHVKQPLYKYPLSAKFMVFGRALFKYIYKM